MTQKEALQLLAVLKAAYPNSYKGMTHKEATGTANVWYMQFADMPADIVAMALNKLIATSKFPPTIAEVKEKITSLHWEAYEAISGTCLKELMPEPLKVKYERIYELTKDYKHKRGSEPGLAQMLQNSQYLLEERHDYE